MSGLEIDGNVIEMKSNGKRMYFEELILKTQ